MMETLVLGFIVTISVIGPLFCLALWALHRLVQAVQSVLDKDLDTSW